MNKKKFVTSTGSATAAFALAPSKNLFAKAPAAKVKMGLMRTGLCRQNHLQLLLNRENIDVVAICNWDLNNIWLKKYGRPFWKSKELGNQTVDSLDFTSWQWMNRKPPFALNDDF